LVVFAESRGGALVRCHCQELLLPSLQRISVTFVAPRYYPDHGCCLRYLQAPWSLVHMFCGVADGIA